MSEASVETLLRIEKGSPSERELAALTAVLLARAGASRTATRSACVWRRPSWRRLERLPVYVNPRAWR
jgi:hypothetical protein